MRRTAALLVLMAVVVGVGRERVGLERVVHAQAPSASEMRGLWIRYGSLESPDAIRKLVATAATAGFNTLFTQTRPEGDSRPLAFDPLAELVSQAHAAGLGVHAWIDVALASRVGEVQASRDHVVYRHPEWIMVPRTLAAELLATDAHAPDYLGKLARWKIGRAHV